MKKISLVCLFVFSLVGLLYAEEDNFTRKTRFGKLTTDSSGILQFRGRLIKPNIYLGVGGNILKTYKLKGKDVLLISQPAGNSCPGNYVFLTLSKSGADVTPEFGTCMDGPVEPKLVGESITFEVDSYGYKGTTRYTYRNGIVTKRVSSKK